MIAMRRCMMRRYFHFFVGSAKNEFVYYYYYASGSKRENQAFNIKTRKGGKIKKGWRIPICRHEKRFGQSGKRCKQAYDQHLSSFFLVVEENINHQPDTD